MEKIKYFVQNNLLTLVAGVAITLFTVWMYSAHKNMEARETLRQARIEQVIAIGGVYQPSAEYAVEGNYVAECEE